MPVATRSSSHVPSTPGIHDRLKKHCPATAPPASQSLHGVEEEDLEDIDGTTLNHPPPDDSISSGSDSDPGSDGLGNEPVTPSKATRALLRDSRLHYPKSSPISHNGGKSSQSKPPATKAGRLSHVAVPASPLRHGRVSVAVEGNPHQLNAVAMLDALPKLEEWSDRILRQWKRPGFSYRGFMNYITNTTEVIRLKHSLEEEYLCYKKHFGDKHFINVVKATEALPSVEDSNWTPEGIYHKANLAQLALDIIYFSNGTNSDSQLDIIDSLFPMPFAPFRKNECASPLNAIREEIFQIGLEIRTQRFVRKMIAVPKRTNPTTILEETFNNASFGDAELRGWEMDGLQDEFGDLTEEYRDQVEGRIQDLRKSFPTDESKPLDTSALEASFPWSDFVVKLADWIRQRLLQLDTQSGAHEDRDAAIARLYTEKEPRPTLDHQRTREIFRPEPILVDSTEPEDTLIETIEPAIHEEVIIPPAPRESTPPVAPNKNFISVGSIRHVLKLRERGRTAPTITQEVQEQPSARLEETRATSVHQIIASQEDTANGGEQGLTGTEARTTAVSSGVTFLHRQNNASRVSPIGSSLALTSEKAPRVNRRKRRRVDDSEESEESAFETDARENVSTSRRTKRPRVERQAQRRRANSPRIEVPRRRQTTQPATSHPPSSRPPSAQPRGSREPEGRKHRVFWSDEEDRQLIRLVRKVGPHWARIEYTDAEEESPKLGSRNQISIKDRARQLKFNFLKNGQPLPKNFKMVGLNQMMKHKLEALNIDHRNAEEESDEEGGRTRR